MTFRGLFFLILVSFLTLIVLFLSLKEYSNNSRSSNEIIVKEDDEESLLSMLERRKKFNSWKAKLVEEQKKDRLKTSVNYYRLVINYDATPPQGEMSVGAMGKAVTTTPEEQEKVREGWIAAHVNQYVSDKIPVNRTLPDVRLESCKVKKYAYSKLPKTSVIISFTEESWSTLLRTIHSIINRTPPELLEEIILVDDYSQRDLLKKPLEDYIEKLPVVKLIRLPRREGLIRARMAGVLMAKSPVVTFLDSHVEVTVGWLEPMVDQVWRERTSVVSPVVDRLHFDTFQYLRRSDYQRMFFKWDLSLQWEAEDSFKLSPAPNFAHWKEDVAARKKEGRVFSEMIKTPVLPGGMFTIDKSYFQELGLFDPGLEVWGFENVELSLKVWMCGGSVLISPCSHVAHLQRNTTGPYSFPDAERFISRNAARVAQVWMDEYEELFHQNRVDTKKFQHSYTLTEREIIRANLDCKSFKWYLNHVTPDLYVPSLDVQGNGYLLHGGTVKCLNQIPHTGGQLTIEECSGYGPLQFFRLGRKGTLEIGQECVGADEQSVRIMPCESNNVLNITHQPVKHLVDRRSGKCVEAVAVKSPQSVNQHNIDIHVVLSRCNPNLQNQKWKFEQYYDKDGKPIYAHEVEEL